jgi:hypothetical protein
MRQIPLFALISLLPLIGCAAGEKNTAGDERGFKPIFNGKTLAGWTAPDMSFWRVEDGAITGVVTKDHKPPENNFILCKGVLVDDFELRFRFRIFGKDANSGMQFRSSIAERGLIKGYQADMSGDGKWTGGIFDEYGPRGSLCARGESTTWSADGKKAVKPLDHEVKVPDTTQWTDYHIIAKGEHVVLKLNGVVTADLHDAFLHRVKRGCLAMPVIPAEMKVQYKDLRLKRL